MTPTLKPNGEGTPEETSRARPYDWARVGQIEVPPSEPAGLLNGTIDAEWTGESWRLSIDRVTDEALRALLGGAASQALIERRDGAGQEKGGNAGEAEEPDVVNPEPVPTSDGWGGYEGDDDG
jgi:hypothetical protein